MARQGITFEQVAAVADALAGEGQQPTIRAVRERLGDTGSPNTIHKHLAAWREARPVAAAAAPELPQALTAAIAAEIERAAAQARAEIEGRLVQAQGEAAELAAAGEVIEAERDALAEQVAELTRERDTLAGKAEQCGPFGVRQLLLCRPYQSGRDAAWLAQLDSRGLGVQRLLCSDELHGFADLREAALALRDLHAYARSRQPELRVLRLPDHRLQAFLHGRRQDWSVQRWLAPLRRVLAQDSQGQLRQTLLAWCRHDGHPQACADELGIHRNTLRRWLQAGKIKVKFRRIDNRKVFEGSEIKKVWRIAL